MVRAQWRTGLDQDGAALWPGTARRALPGAGAPRALEDDHLRWRSQAWGNDRTHGARRRHVRRRPQPWFRAPLSRSIFAGSMFHVCLSPRHVARSKSDDSRPLARARAGSGEGRTVEAASGSIGTAPGRYPQPGTPKIGRDCDPKCEPKQDGRHSGHHIRLKILVGGDGLEPPTSCV